MIPPINYMFYTYHASGDAIVIATSPCYFIMYKHLHVVFKTISSINIRIINSKKSHTRYDWKCLKSNLASLLNTVNFFHCGSLTNSLDEQRNVYHLLVLYKSFWRTHT